MSPIGRTAGYKNFPPPGLIWPPLRGAEGSVGEIRRPTGVAVDAEGDVYVTDWDSPPAADLCPGRDLYCLSGWRCAADFSLGANLYCGQIPTSSRRAGESNLEPEWRFRRPVAVNVDAAGRIFVLEATRRRLQVYNKVKDFEEALP